jgi:hypothetical protein
LNCGDVLMGERLADEKFLRFTRSFSAHQFSLFK